MRAILFGLALLALASADQYCHHGTYHCDCKFGYTGANCDTPINFCNETEIMSNGQEKKIKICGHGTCINTPDGAACNCDPGWDGPFCKQDINDCKPVNPCQNGGTCINQVGPGYDCICDKLHVGKNCENHKDFCQNEEIYDGDGNVVIIEVCGGHGQCVNGPNGATCICYHGWTGPFCQHEIEYNCTSGGVTHQHGSTWNERCNTCTCEYGVTTCEQGYWCPQRCAIFSTPKVQANGITVGCKPYENCIPDTVECARENPYCDYPIGWCFPVGVVMLQDLTTPATP